MRGHFSFREHLKDTFLQTNVGFVGVKTPNALDFRVEGIWLNDCLWTEPFKDPCEGIPESRAFG